MMKALLTSPKELRLRLSEKQHLFLPVLKNHFRSNAGCGGGDGSSVSGPACAQAELVLSIRMSVSPARQSIVLWAPSGSQLHHPPQTHLSVLSNV